MGSRVNLPAAASGGDSAASPGDSPASTGDSATSPGDSAASGGASAQPRRSALAGTMTLVEGVTFCICAVSGDIRPGAEQGLFFRDTRFLSEFTLTVDGAALEPLAARRPSPYAGVFIGRRPARPGRADSTLLVVRERYVGDGMREDIAVRNLSSERAEVALTLTVNADFAGLFAVKEGRAGVAPGIERTGADDTVRLRSPKVADGRGVAVTGSLSPAASTGGLTWRLSLPPRSGVMVTVMVVPDLGGIPVPSRYRPDQPVEASQPAARLAAWRQLAPAVSTPDDRLAALLSASAEDLGVLRISQPDQPERVVIAAGAPWFMTLFGRDSLLTSWMLLPLDPAVALGTLQTLAKLQGSRVDPGTEEEPGRILHEVRSGLDPAAPGGRSVYYGSVDATPLFVLLLGELRRWGAGLADVRPLLPHADRALDWVERYGDRDRDGFVEYQRSTEHGLANQGWKDSFDAISFADGRLADPPIALAEVQGYVYAAYLARAQFAREAGERDLAAHWADRAARLKRRFNEAFWLPARGYFALALDGSKRPVDALASNMGHCLWTGIADEEKAARAAEHLLSPEMFTGFGVRTLGASMAAYNPVSYHNGSVWPHDNAIIAAGLMRYGFAASARRIALGLVSAGTGLGGRLPELFCGFDRAEFPAPVPYPTACSPQAWAAAAPFHLLRTLLRLEPDIPAGQVWCEPAVPDEFLPLRVDRLSVAAARVSVTVRRDGWGIDGLPDGVRLVRAARGLGSAIPRAV
jgi:glycogen debranching enzyme